MPDTETQEDKGAFMEAPVNQGPTAADLAMGKKAVEAGITGDPDAPPGYFVDENFRPNPLDLGSLITTEYHGKSSYDLANHSGLIANAGVNPLDLEETTVPESPEPPPPMGATDYDPTLAAGVPSEQALQDQHQADQAAATKEALHKAHQETVARLQAEKAGQSGNPTSEVQDKAEKTVEAAQETVEAAKAPGAAKAAPAKQAAKQAPQAPNPAARNVAPPASPAGTKDTSLETHVTDAEGGGSASS